MPLLSLSLTMYNRPVARGSPLSLFAHRGTQEEEEEGEEYSGGGGEGGRYCGTHERGTGSPSRPGIFFLFVLCPPVVVVMLAGGTGSAVVPRVLSLSLYPFLLFASFFF